jgi:hypothetical protein
MYRNFPRKERSPRSCARNMAIARNMPGRPPSSWHYVRTATPRIHCRPFMINLSHRRPCCQRRYRHENLGQSLARARHSSAISTKGLQHARWRAARRRDLAVAYTGDRYRWISPRRCATAGVRAQCQELRRSPQLSDIPAISQNGRQISRGCRARNRPGRPPSRLTTGYRRRKSRKCRAVTTVTRDKPIHPGGWSRCVKMGRGAGRAGIAAVVVAGVAAGVRVRGAGSGRAARDAGALWDASPLISLALGP